MKSLFKLSAVAALICLPSTLFAQARATAKRTFQLQAFGLLSGTYTGLSGGRNLAFTLGGDLGFYYTHGVLLSAEVRGTYPVAKGDVDAQKSLLGGLRADHRFSRATVFGDALFGRGGIEYVNGGYVVPPLVYFSSNTSVYGAGGGVEFDVARGLGLRVEGQVQHWSTPVVSSGTIYPKQIGVGVVYRFGANGRPVNGVRD